MTSRRKKPADEAALKDAILAAALIHAAGEGFGDATLQKAGADAGSAPEMLLHLFPDGVTSLLEFYSQSCDADMEARLAAKDLPSLKMRARIATAVLERIETLKPHKEAARRAAAYLSLPMHAALGTRLTFRTVDAMWRAAGDTATDFSFYSKRGILAAVYGATLVRWFTDEGADERATRDFLDARIENVMQFEKFKATVRDRTKDWPSFTDIVAGFSARRS